MKHFYLLPLFLAANAFALSSMPPIDPEYLHVVDRCANASAAKQVLFIKQWHLAPSVDTFGDIQKSKQAPQYENQKDIYEQLDQWVGSQEVKTIFAEGCPYPRAIDSNSPEKFNGWSVQELQQQVKNPSFPDIVTNVVFKLEAKWRDKLSARCGDDPAAIKKNLLAFSDARGIVGFMTRLEQFKKDPVRAKPYLDGVIQLYRLPETTTVPQALRRLDTELEKTVNAIQKWIQVRNEKLVSAIVSDPSPRIAVVFGGAHADGVRKLLDQKKIGCLILEPQGYRDDESELLRELTSLMRERHHASGR